MKTLKQHLDDQQRALYGLPETHQLTISWTNEIRAVKEWLQEQQIVADNKTTTKVIDWLIEELEQ